ncbi:hypothetical protein [Sphingobacterium lactis]|uniref:Uncharacterized protein n=1 Tax=Sphingobacterium lactis TaxID=797291 RepID=A0A1H6CQW2_9SPHI|nr:hypothetical protein [Sphingobacterium lactis]SEG75344.1 hypothetical protein SAMN05421877_1191 [Sphingobacterium lactis]
MKKILLIILWLIPFVSFSQIDYDTYFISTGGAKEELKIQVSEKGGTLDQVFIYAKSLEGEHYRSVLIIDAKKLPTFIEYLKFVKNKYSEWSETAKNNNVHNLLKDIDADLKDYYMVGFAIGDWYFDRRVKIKAKFSVDNESMELYLYTDKLYSSTNTYIDNKGLFIPFSNNEDLDLLIKKLEVDVISNFLKSNKGKESLFN